jgi:hypothetical protein
MTIRSALRFGHSFDGSRMVLRIDALIEAIVRRMLATPPQPKKAVKKKRKKLQK